MKGGDGIYGIDIPNKENLHACSICNLSLSLSIHIYLTTWILQGSEILDP